MLDVDVFHPLLYSWGLDQNSDGQRQGGWGAFLCFTLTKEWVALPFIFYVSSHYQASVSRRRNCTFMYVYWSLSVTVTRDGYSYLQKIQWWGCWKKVEHSNK